MRHISRINIWDTATTVASTSTITSSAVDQKYFDGAGAAVRVVISGSSPSVAITMTVSDTKNGSYVIPYDTDGTSLGDVAAVGSELTASRWVYYSPPLAKYVKFTVTGSATNGADTTVTMHLTMVDD